jgi:hypothetical protein
MKKNLVLVVCVVVVFLIAAVAVKGNSAEDYKVIQKAVSEKKASGDVTFFRLEVKDKKTNKAEVNIKIPLSLVELMSDCVKDQPKVKEHCDIDFKKIIAELKKSGNTTLIEVDSDDSLVKIWLE